MAIFPRSEPEKLQFLRIVSDVLEAHRAHLPDAAARRGTLEQSRAEYASSVATRDAIAEQLRLANEEKDRRLDDMVGVLKAEYQRLLDEARELPAELRAQVVEEIEAGLVEQSDQPPSAPRELTGTIVSPGAVQLEWRRPRKTKGGRVSSYLVERRSAAAPGQFGEWQFLNTSYVPEISLHREPTSHFLEYRVWAHNKSGRSAEAAILLLAPSAG